MTYKWSSKNKNLHSLYLLKIVWRLFLKSISCSKKSLRKYNDANLPKFWFWQKIAKNCHFFLAIFLNFWWWTVIFVWETKRFLLDFLRALYSCHFFCLARSSICRSDSEVILWRKDLQYSAWEQEQDRQSSNFCWSKVFFCDRRLFLFFGWSDDQWSHNVPTITTVAWLKLKKQFEKMSPPPQKKNNNRFWWGLWPKMHLNRFVVTWKMIDSKRSKNFVFTFKLFSSSWVRLNSNSVVATVVLIFSSSALFWSISFVTTTNLLSISTINAEVALKKQHQGKKNK